MIQQTFDSNIKRQPAFWFLCAVLLFVFAYSLPTLTTKPAYWYDEAINVELARNFADFGNLDLIVAPNTFSGAGATVGSTGYPVTVPLAGFFKVFGFGLEQARVYMLLWMSAFLLFFFLIAKNLLGSPVAYWGTLFIASFAPFYGNGRSVMGEIPGFLFFLCSFYFLEQKKWWQSGILLGLAAVSKPSVFVFLIPAYVLTVLCSDGAGKEKFIRLFKIGVSSFAALIPWFVIYADEIARGGLGGNILNHFKNPYQEAGVSISANISYNLGTFFQSTTLLYFTVLIILIVAALYLDRGLFRVNRGIFILSAVYIPFSFFQYLKSFGYLRYLIAAEFLVFMLFVISLPTLVRFVVHLFCHPSPPAQAGLSVCPAHAGGNDRAVVYTRVLLCAMIAVQTVHLFWFSDVYLGEKTQKTLVYLSSVYPDSAIGIMNVPQVGSFIASDRKYQYLSTYGLWKFGTNPLLLPPEQMPNILVVDSDDPVFSAFYKQDPAFSEGFVVYKRK